ncbi:MAG: hypothetical protein ACQEWV_32815 [Bacillota bacterium]
MNQQMHIIKNDKIIKALKNTTRQYFVGKLTRPQELNYIEDDKLEIGITHTMNFIVKHHIIIHKHMNINI